MYIPDQVCHMAQKWILPILWNLNTADPIILNFEKKDFCLQPHAPPAVADMKIFKQPWKWYLIKIYWKIYCLPGLQIKFWSNIRYMRKYTLIKLVRQIYFKDWKKWKISVLPFSDFNHESNGRQRYFF